MMESRAFTGNCYSDMGDFSRMMEHYAVAGRLAEALGAAETQEVIRYNMAATQLSPGPCPGGLRLLFRQKAAYRDVAA